MLKVTRKLKLVSALMAVEFLLFSCLELAPATASSLPIADPAALQVNVPEEFGTVKEIYRGTSEKTIYYIQDAHTSLEAQQSIARIIHFLVQNAQVPVVFEEGYEGKVPSDDYFNFQDPMVKKKTAFFFLDHLRIGGAEYAHILRRKPFRLLGIDPMELYQENIRQYARVEPLQKMIAKDLEALEEKLHALVPRLFPREFYAWFKGRRKYLRGEVELPRYLDETLAYYQKLCAARKKTPQRFSQTERIQALLKGGPAESKGQPAEDVQQLLKEMERLEKAVVRQGLEAEEARQLYAYLDTLQVLNRLVYLKMSSSDFERYCLQIKKLQTRDISNFLALHNQRNFVVSSYWEEWIQTMSRFYELARQREQSIGNIVRFPWKRAALVYGGFHQQGILEKLREQGVSYAVISPRIQKLDPVHEERYQALMNGGHYVFESGLFAQAARPPSVYVMGPRDDVKDLIEQRALLLQARSEVRSSTPPASEPNRPAATVTAAKKPSLAKRSWDFSTRFVSTLFFRAATAGLIMIAALFIFSPTSRPWLRMGQQMADRQMERLGIQSWKETGDSASAENPESFLENHPERISQAAKQIAAQPVKTAAKTLAGLNRAEVSLIAAEHAKPDSRQSASQAASLVRAVEPLSYDRARLYELAYQTAVLNYDSSPEANDRWIELYRRVSAAPQAEETAVLRSIASVLDKLPAPRMIALLEKAGRAEWTRKVIEQMPFIVSPHKERLVKIQQTFIPAAAFDPAAAALRGISLKPAEFRQEIELLANTANWRAAESRFMTAAALRELLNAKNLDAEQRKELAQLYEKELLPFSTTETLLPAEVTLWAEVHLRYATFFKEAASADLAQEIREKYTRLSQDAAARGLKVTEQLRKELPGRLHQANQEALDLAGEAYPEWIHLFDAAFQWDGHVKWLQSFRHVSLNLLANQALSKNKAFSEYVLTDYKQPVIQYEGKEFDLFDGLRQGAADLSFAPRYGVLPTFSVGYNAEQQRPITESELQVILSVVVTGKHGQLVDELSFQYGADGRLTGIQSKTQSLRFRAAAKLLLKKLTVYVKDLKTGIPGGTHYESVNNEFGQMQYWVLREIIDIRGGIQKKPVNVVMKDSSGRARLDWAALSGVLPDSGLFRISNRTNAPKSLSYQGRTLAALARVRQRAAESHDTALASAARTAADLALQPFFDHTGGVRIHKNGQLWALDFSDRRQEVLPLFTQPAEKLWLQYGASFWISDFEQANELIQKSLSSGGQEPSIPAALIHPLVQRRGPEASVEVWHSSSSPETLTELSQTVSRYFRYGRTTAEFKWARAVLYPVQLDAQQPDMIFLKWKALPQAHWYLVRQYAEMPGGSWKLIEENDQWTRDTFLSVDNPRAQSRKYSVIGFTADPLFEANGPFHAVRSEESARLTLQTEKSENTPGKAEMILPKRHGVQSNEEWIDLTDTGSLRVEANEFMQFPHGHAEEWELSTDPDFKNRTHRFLRENKLKSLYLGGLPNGDYYIRMRLWSGPRDKLKEPWMTQGRLNWEGRQGPFWKGAVQSQIRLRDDSIITWPAVDGARFYRVRIWYEEDGRDTFVRDRIVVAEPFLQVRNFTLNPINRIEIEPYSGHPDLGGIRGGASGVLKIQKVNPVEVPANSALVTLTETLGDFIVGWAKTTSAGIYRIQTLSAGSADDKVLSEFWSGEASTSFTLPGPAKQVRVQPWTSHPAKGGSALKDFSSWQTVDANFRTPAAVPAGSVRILPISETKGRPLPVLTFSRSEGVEGYRVLLHHVRYGEMSFWVPQPSENRLPELGLSKDVQAVSIQALSRQVEGKASEVTRVELTAQVPLDELQAPFEVDTTAGTPAFYYPLDKIPAQGMRVYIQYASQYADQEERQYPVFQGDLFRPSQSLDRMKARIVWMDGKGNVILGDWSNWKEIRLRLAAPPAVRKIIQESAVKGGSQTVRAVVTADSRVDKPAIQGFRWQTRMDLNDPTDETREYTTAARYSGTRLLNSPDTLVVPRPANFVRAKAVTGFSQAEVESETWSEWIPVSIRPEQPLAVSDIQVLADGHQLRFKAEKNVRVSRYLIETSHDPFNGVQPTQTYTQRVVRENDQWIDEGTLFDLPAAARYVRVTPVVSDGEDTRVYGQSSGWVRIETKDIVRLDRMAEPENRGAVIYGRSIPGATHYRIQMKNRYGTVREVMSPNTWVKATGSFTAYRMQPLIAKEKNGMDVIQSEGEFTGWKSVPEVFVEEPPVPTLGLRHLDEYGLNQLVWTAQYRDETARRFNITTHGYQLEFEDAWGNRFGENRSVGNVYDLTGHEVRVRIRAMKQNYDGHPHHTGLLKLEQMLVESDWSEWFEIGNGKNLLVKNKPSVEMTKDGHFFIAKPVPGAGGYKLVTVGRQGYRAEMVYDLETLKRLQWKIPIERFKNDPTAKFMWLPVRRLSAIHNEIVPAFAHDWIYMPDVELDILPRPRLLKNRPNLTAEERHGKNFRGPLRFYQFGLDPTGQMSFLGREDRQHFWDKSGMLFWGYATTELNVNEDIMRESAFSDLVPAFPREEVPRPATMNPQSPEINTAPVITWPQVRYRVSVTSAHFPEKAARIFFTQEPYPPADAIPEGQASYQIDIEPVTAFQVRLEREDGPVFEFYTKSPFFNLSEAPAGNYRSAQVLVLTDGEPTGVHGKWSEVKALKVARKDSLLTNRPVSQTEWVARHSDGAEVYYSRKDGSHLRSVPGADGKMPVILAPEAVNLRGSRWKPVENDALEDFRGEYFPLRYLMQSNAWNVSIPLSVHDQPGNLLGVDSSAALHWTDSQSRRHIVPGRSMALDSKEHENTAPGSIETRWTSLDGGIKFFSRKYLVPDFKAGVSEFSVQTWDGRAEADPVMALKLDPSVTQSSVRVMALQGYHFFWFGSGQFAAVADRDLAGWYLGPDSQGAALDPKMANGALNYRKAGESAVIYLRLKPSRLALDHGPQGIFNPELGDRLNSVFVFSGQAQQPAELGSILTGALQFSANYEKAFTSFARHGSQTGVLSKEWADLFFTKSLSNQAWRTMPNGHRTYWEMAGLSETAPKHVLWTNASWTGNSALMQQLNTRMLPVLRARQGHDRINAAGEGLLADRIIPNADWIQGQMQTPADSFYMKSANAMRAFFLPGGEYSIDNQQISAILSRPAGIALMRGYEPLDGLSIAGGGFTLDAKGTPELWNLQKPEQFNFYLDLAQNKVVDPAQPYLSGTRVYEQRQGKGRVEETVTLAKGEYALRYQLKLQAHQALEVKNTRVAMSYLDADQDLENNPERMPGYQGENSLVIPGMDRPYRARELLEGRTGMRIESGSWVDLLELFKKDGELTDQGRAVKKTLRDIGALGVMGWDKAGMMAVPGGVDYDKGSRVMVRMDEFSGDRDHDVILEFTDIAIELAPEGGARQLRAKEIYASPTVYFTNFWLRLGVTDDRGMPEDLKHLSAEWISKVTRQEADSISLETDYAYTDAIIALWKTADLMLDEMQKAQQENRPEDVQRYRGLASRYGLAALRATVAARDADHSFYDLNSGAVREDIMNFKGVMRFYGTYALTYGMARDFAARIEQLENSDPPFVFLPSAEGRRQPMEQVILTEALEMARQEKTSRDQSGNPIERLQHQARFEIYASKAAKFEALAAGLETEALERLVQQGEQALHDSRNLDDHYQNRVKIYFAARQLAYARLLQKYETVFSGKTTADYWSREVLYNAERILDLQEKDPTRPNYGGFYQNEQPSKMQLDDNGTKLQALRTAYELVSREILAQTKRKGLRLASSPRMIQLYAWRQAYLDAAELNIGHWLRVDARDGHLYGWESALREQNFDSQRTEYGNAVYRRGLGSWIDLIPQASEKFDQSSRQHKAEREDGTRNFSPTGHKMFVSPLNPANGNDVTTEIMPLEMMAYLDRAQGGTYGEEKTPELLEAGENSKEPHGPLIRPVWSRAEWAALLQIMMELVIGLQILRWLVSGAKELWHRAAKVLKVDPFLAYQGSILSSTLILGWLYALTHDFSHSSLLVVLLMASAATYVMKNVAETVVRYFRIGMIRDRHRHRGISRLNSGSFRRRIPLHLGTLLSVPVVNTHEKDARVSHGTAEEATGAFHNSVFGNLEDSQGLFFHINDNSGRAADAAGFDPTAFHENYIRQMRERYGDRFIYTHQAKSPEKKLGVVQNLDSWWVALRETALDTVDAAWDQLTEKQQTALKRLAYGTREPLELLEKKMEGESLIRLPGGYEVRTVLPESEETESHLEVPVKRPDGLTAVLSFWIRRTADGWEVYHHQESPEDDTVILRETVSGRLKDRLGLAVLEKEAMIKEEARALLYYFWASEYGGTDLSGDENNEPLSRVTSGKSDTLTPALRAAFREDLTAAGLDVDAFWGWDSAAQESRPGSFAASLSRAMAQHEVDYFHKVRDLKVWKDLNFDGFAAQQGVPSAALLPQAFAESIQAWTETAEGGLVPLEGDVGKRAVPGHYYTFNEQTGVLEPYQNKALEMIDQTALVWEKVLRDGSLTAFGQKKEMQSFLQEANSVLKQIHEIMPVRKSYQVRYNPSTRRTEVLEESWNLYQYEYEDGSRKTFFRVERKVRLDTLVGHLPTLGPLAYGWRFDADTHSGKGEKDTLVQGILRAGHPHYQPVLDAETGRTVSGYGGMVLPIRISNRDATLWTEIENRNRDKSGWDLRGQWLGFGEAQYTGKGIENLVSADKSKSHSMPKGFYLSHDMVEQGYNGPEFSDARIKDRIRRGDVVLQRYGRPMSTEEALEVLALSVQRGGFGLLEDLWGYEDYFDSHSDTLFKVMGQWKKGDWQWLHAAWGGLDIRGLLRLPGMMPGYTVSERRTLEQTAALVDGKPQRSMTGQDYKVNPLSQPQKYFLTRTVEDDQRGAVMFVWLAASLMLTILNHNTYTLIYNPLLGALLLAGSVILIVFIMKFSTIFKNIRREGLRPRHLNALWQAAGDTLIETGIVTGINLWKSFATSVQIMLSVPSMKWVTAAGMGQRPGVFRTVREYGIGALIGFSFVAFILAFHPTGAWLFFGSLFLGSLVAGPLLTWITAHSPLRARLFLGLTLLSASAAAYGISRLDYDTAASSARHYGLWGGVTAFAVLVILIAGQGIWLAGKSVFVRARHGMRKVPPAVLTWFRGLGTLNLYVVFLHPFYTGGQSFLTRGKRLSFRSAVSYFFVSGKDPDGYFPNQPKAVGNLAAAGLVWVFPLLVPQLYLPLAGGNLAFATALAAFHVGLFFPVGFWLLERVLNPARPFRLYQPVDYLRAAFHMVSAVIGLGLWTVKKAGVTLQSAVMAPSNQAVYRDFIRHPASDEERFQSLARQTASLLRNSPSWFRRQTARVLAQTPAGDQRLRALLNAGFLDERMERDLTDEFSKFYVTPAELPQPSSEGEPPQKPPLRSEVRNASWIQSARGLNVSKRERAAGLISDMQNLQGAVILSALDVKNFSPAQKEEMVKTALSRRARVFVYESTKLTPEEHASLARGTKIRLVPDGRERALRLASGALSVIEVIGEQTENSVGTGRVETPEGTRIRVKIFKQVTTGEPGLISAALLAAQYGDRYRFFVQEGSVFILKDSAVLQLLQSYLQHELIGQSA